MQVYVSEVFVVDYRYWDDGDVLAIFDTREAAEAYRDWVEDDNWDEVRIPYDSNISVLSRPVMSGWRAD